MPFELIDCVDVMLREIANPAMTQRDVAQTYRLALASSEARTIDWGAVNRAIIKRWSASGLVSIKEMAWSGKCFAPAKA